MKNAIGLILLVGLLNACADGAPGATGAQGEQGQQGEQGVPGPTVTVTPTPNPTSTESAQQLLVDQVNQTRLAEGQEYLINLKLL